MNSAFIKSPVGPLHIVSSENHITEISFINSLKGKNIPEEEIDYSISSDPLINRCAQQMTEYFSGIRTSFDFPMKPDGTGFQQSVWNNLLSIPFGRTISYMHLSKQLSNPKAIRAVGTANGSNKIVIAIPCHRVIGTNGSLVGYGGDLWRKKWLLDHEAKFANGVQKLF